MFVEFFFADDVDFALVLWMSNPLSLLGILMPIFLLSGLLLAKLLSICLMRTVLTNIQIIDVVGSSAVHF